MFDLFYNYPHSHSFYLPADIYYKLRVEKITSNLIGAYFKSNGINTNCVKIKVQQINKLLYYIVVKFKEENEKNKLVDLVTGCSDFFSPWEVFPNMFQGSPRWNQGVEEHYAINCWLPFWNILTDKQKDEYRLKYSCPLEWSAWLQDNIK